METTIIITLGLAIVLLLGGDVGTATSFPSEIHITTTQQQSPGCLSKGVFLAIGAIILILVLSSAGANY